MTYYSVVQTDLALLQWMYSRYRISSFFEAAFLSVRFPKSPKNRIKLQGEMYDQSNGSNIIIFWEIQVSPTMWVFSPLWETCEQLRRNSFASHRMNLSGHSSKIMRDISFFRNWNVTFFWPVRERQTSSLRAKQEEFVDSWPELT